MVTFFDIVLGRATEAEARYAREHRTPLSEALRQYDAEVLATQGASDPRKRTIRLLADFVGYQEDDYYTRPDQLGPDALPTHLADLAETGDLSATKRRRLERVLPAFLAYLATRQRATAEEREEVMEMAKEPIDDAVRAQMDRLRELAQQAPRGRARGKVKVTFTTSELEDVAQLIRAGLLARPDYRSISPRLKGAMTTMGISTKGL
jgi:hypothetical protein